jgi:hypothetical protein
MRPAVPVYWRCTPVVAVPFLEVSRLVHDRHRARVAQVLDDIAAHVLTRQHTAR